MRTTILAAVAVTLCASQGFAQESVRQPPEVLIGGDSKPSTKYESCVDVEIGGDRSFGCLNQTIKRQVEKVNPSLNLPPVDARSPDVRLGIVNLPAVQQQYGRNYGVSVIPFRPAPPVFAAPVGPRR